MRDRESCSPSAACTMYCFSRDGGWGKTSRPRRGLRARSSASPCACGDTEFGCSWEDPGSQAGGWTGGLRGATLRASVTRKGARHWHLNWLHVPCQNGTLISRGHLLSTASGLISLAPCLLCLDRQGSGTDNVVQPTRQASRSDWPPSFFDSDARCPNR